MGGQQVHGQHFHDGQSHDKQLHHQQSRGQKLEEKPAREAIRIAAVGDVALLQPPGKDLWREVWDGADARLANLEGPIVRKPGPPAEKLIRLRMPAEAAGWLRDLGTTAVSLANNHMLDWGYEGLAQTLEALDGVGIVHAGAGRDVGEAGRAEMLHIAGYKVALLSWAATVPTGFAATDRRPGIAGVRIRTSVVIDGSIADEQPGTPPWVHTEPVEEDLRRLETTLQEARAAADFVILAMHWGVPPQWSSVFQGPVAEYQGVIAKRAVAAGADVIVGHHCHAPYGLEAVGEGAGTSGRVVPVLYSLGNFIFHPEYLPGGLDFSPLTVPYHAPKLPENHQSCVVELELRAANSSPGVDSYSRAGSARADGSARTDASAQAEGGRLSLARVTMHAALLNERGEAAEVTEEQARPIVDRLCAFSVARGTKVQSGGRTLVWRAE